MTMALIAGGVAAAGAIGGAVISSDASKNAASQQANSAASASQVQQNEFNTINAENAGNRNLGYGADDLLAQAFGIANPTAAGASNYYPGTNSGTAVSNAGPTSLPGATAPTGAAAGGTGGGYSSAISGSGSGLVGGGGASGPSLVAAGPTAVTGVSGASGGAASPGGLGTANYTPTASGTNPAVGGASQNPNYSNFYNTPGYSFTLNQGENAIARGASANGGLYDTSTLGALNNYAQGAASTQYNNYVSQLMGMAGLGQSATNTTSQAATNTGNNISNNTISAGNANASGTLGSAGAWNGALTGVAGAVNNSGLVTNPSNNNGNPYALTDQETAQGAQNANATAHGYYTD